VSVPIVRRQELATGESIDGPAIVEEAESTTVVGPDERCRVDATGSLILSIEAARVALGRGDSPRR